MLPLHSLLDLFFGSGAIGLHAVSCGRAIPAWGYMGGKRKLAGRILGTAGWPLLCVPTRLVGAEIGPLGWAWRALQSANDTGAIVQVLRSWASEGPRALWTRLSQTPPFADPIERAAQVLWLQARIGNNSPLRWDDARQWWRMDATGQAAQFRGNRGPLDVRAFADRVADMARWLHRPGVNIVHDDVCAAIPEGDLSGWLAILDPPYVDRTNYAGQCSRGAVLALIEDLHRRGAVTAVCEAEPVGDGEIHDITLPGGRPEWVTVRRQS